MALKAGFTLIEISIVLVIIGFIVGGVLVGQDLIRAAGERAQITQIEKYNSAVNTFRGRFNALPGDLNEAIAATFGFVSRGEGNGNGYAGAGDGNGLIEGFYVANSTAGVGVGAGEPVFFWNDLTYANGMNLNLVEGGFSVSGGSGAAGNPIPPGITGTNINLWYPSAKIGGENYVYVYSQNGFNYFGLSPVTSITFWYIDSTPGPGLTVRQAYDIDKKVDDGLPQSGNVVAMYVNEPYGGPGGLFPAWAANGGNGANSGSPNYGPTTSATPGSITTCYDNGNSAGAPQQYSLEISNGSYANCALSFKMQ